MNVNDKVFVLVEHPGFSSRWIEATVVKVNKVTENSRLNEDSFSKEYKYLKISPENFKVGDFFLSSPNYNDKGFFGYDEKVEILSITLPKDGRGNTAIIKTKEEGDIKLSNTSLYDIARKK